MEILILVALLLSGAWFSTTPHASELASGNAGTLKPVNAGSAAVTALGVSSVGSETPTATYVGDIGDLAVARSAAPGMGGLVFVSADAIGASRLSAASASHPGASKSVWQWPLVGPDGSQPTVVRPFDPPAHRWLAGHRGVDLVAPGAAEVLAAGPGTVAFAGTLFGQGVVVVSHGAVRTSYEPVAPAATIHVGDSVVAGTPLGTLSPGHCRGSPCLHWGLLTGHGHGVRYYDPLLLLGLVHLRLEPVGQVGGVAAGSG